MSKNEWKELVGVAGRMLLALVFVFSQTAWARQSQQSKDKADSLQKAAAQQKAAAAAQAKTSAEVEESEGAVAQEKKSDDPAHQGIRVHGHWTIEVRSPDGTLVTHREFENSYASAPIALTVGVNFPEAVNALPGILAGTITVGSTWRIRFWDNSGGPCLNGVGKASPCEIEESTFSPPFTTFFPNLSVQAPQSGSSAGQFVLSGTAAPSVPGTIVNVATLVGICPATIAPASCVGGNDIARYFLTATQLSSAITFAAGQTVAITVVMSFS